MLLDAYIELKVGIDWDYDPPQKQTHTDPSFDASLEITSVMHNGVEMIEMCTDDTIAQLRDQAVAHVEAINDRGNEP